MKIKNTLFVILMLSLPAISAEHSEMKMSDMHSSASSQEYMAGMKDMHEKMMAAVNEPDPDKAFAKGMIAHHEGAIAMAETFERPYPPSSFGRRSGRIGMANRNGRAGCG